jgi:ribonuclease Z
MTFEILILGSSSATPIYSRHPTAQVVNIHERLFLVDCGEGTLIQLNRYHVKFHRINHIFISHLHGDHYLGIVGLLSTLHLQGRQTDLHLYCPPELEEIIEIQLKYSQTALRYKIVYHHIDAKNPIIIYKDDELEIQTIIMNHRIPCTGFLFTEKAKTRKLLKDKLAEYKIPVESYNDLKDGKDYVSGDLRVPNGELTSDPIPPRKYAFCSDTIYDERIIPFIKGVDLLYHESTFLSDKLERAQETFHTTATQAGMIAKKSEVKRLIIGHFSARYKNIYPLLEEAKQVFPNSTLAIEGDVFPVGEN